VVSNGRPTPAGHPRWQCWPSKGPTRNEDFLLYIRELHVPDLDMMELVYYIGEQSIRTRHILLECLLSTRTFILQIPISNLGAYKRDNASWVPVRSLRVQRFGPSMIPRTTFTHSALVSVRQFSFI
jgi:hypothetical protein